MLDMIIIGLVFVALFEIILMWVIEYYHIQRLKKMISLCEKIINREGVWKI